MNVQELIDKLQKIPDKKLPVRVCLNDRIGREITSENLWIRNLEVSNTHESGYEIEGEIRLIVQE